MMPAYDAVKDKLIINAVEIVSGNSICIKEEVTNVPLRPIYDKVTTFLWNL